MNATVKSGKMNVKLIAIAVVVIVVVAAIAAGVVLMNNNSNGGSKTAETGTLEVYGNANGDYTLDKNDVDTINKIVNDKLDWTTDYPFADANQDGSVTSADADYVNKILSATSTDKVLVYHNNQTTTGRYVASTMYPVSTIFSSSAQTSIILLKSLGIDDEVKGTSFYYADSDGNVKKESYDKYIYDEYFDTMTKDTRISTSSAGISLDTDAVKNNSDTKAFYYSASNARISNEATVESYGIDVIQLADGSSDMSDYCSAVLILGFLMDKGDKVLVNKSVELAQWYMNFSNDLKDHTSKIAAKDILNGVASSMNKYVSVKGSSNTIIINDSGLNCPLANKSPATGSSSTMTYVGGTDTWLNYISLDTVVCLKGSTSGWSWFDKNYATADIPSAFVDHAKNFSTLQCYLNNNVVIVSTMIPGPLKSAVIGEYFYDEYFEDGFADKYITEFFEKFWGWDSTFCSGQKYILTQEDLGLKQ